VRASGCASNFELSPNHSRLLFRTELSARIAPQVSAAGTDRSRKKWTRSSAHLTLARRPPFLRFVPGNPGDSDPSLSGLGCPALACIRKRRSDGSVLDDGQRPCRVLAAFLAFRRHPTPGPLCARSPCPMATRRTPPSRALPDAKPRLFRFKPCENARDLPRGWLRSATTTPLSQIMSA
jgi:hypothetical protein